MELKGCQTARIGTTVTGPSRWNMFSQESVMREIVTTRGGIEYSSGLQLSKLKINKDVNGESGIVHSI
jgi:hypothetical protein